MQRPAILLACLLPFAAMAEVPELRFPFPVAGVEALPPEHDSYALPVGPWTDGRLPVEMVEGMVDRRAWRLDASGASLLDVLAPLRAQLQAQGYRIATEVMTEPAMHVDPGDFRFLSARRGEEAVSLLVSRSGATAFVQVVTVGAQALPSPVVPPAAEADGVSRNPGNANTGDAGSAEAGSGVEIRDAAAAEEGARPPVPAVAPGDVVARLAAGFPVVLEGLEFASGSAELAGGEDAALASLAEWLRADPQRRVVLVGHTDISGELKPNIALSQKRAEAVRQELVARFGVAPGQVAAEGVGPLAPRDTNLTEEGRLRNRRVEAIPAPT